MQDTHGCKGLKRLDHPDSILSDRRSITTSRYRNALLNLLHDPRGPSKSTRITTKGMYIFSLGPIMTRTTADRSCTNNNKSKKQLCQIHRFDNQHGWKPKSWKGRSVGPRAEWT